jgi:KDO2-lipid IV(A) lauroyltransferase
VKKAQHLIEYALLRFVVAILTRIPRRAADRMGAALGRLGYSPFRIRRTVVEQNLQRAFPEKSQEWRDDVARKAFEHLGREMLAMLRLARLSREEIVGQANFVDLNHADEVFRAKGKGAVIVVGHFGNWEIGAATMATRGYPLDVIAQRQANPWFDRHLVATRERFGIRVIERSKAPREGLRSLRKGRVVVFASDQNGGRNGVFVPFFGSLASTHRGAALMAIRTGAPVIMAFPLRQPDGSYLTRVELLEANPENLHDDPDVAMELLTARFTARLEAAIRENPDQYLWHHRRWKTRPDGNKHT